MKAQDETGKIMLLLSLTLLVDIIALCMEVYIYLITISLAVFAYIFDTTIDIINGGISLFGFIKAEKLKKEGQHHYKYMAFIATIISVFIISSTFEILQELLLRIAGKKFEIHMNPMIMPFFIVIAIMYSILAYAQNRFSRRSSSLIVEFSAFRCLVEALFAIVIFVGILCSLLGFWWADIIVALIIVCVIFSKAIGILKKSSKILLDVPVINPKKLRKMILKAFKGKIFDCVDITSRTDGERVFLELTLKMRGDISLDEAHKIAMEVEDFIKKKYRKLKFARILIHPEPCIDSSKMQKI